MKCKLILTPHMLDQIIRFAVTAMVQGDFVSIGDIALHDTGEERWRGLKHINAEVTIEVIDAISFLTVEDALAAHETLKTDTQEQRKAVVDRWLQDKLNLAWMKNAMALAEWENNQDDG